MTRLSLGVIGAVTIACSVAFVSMGSWAAAVFMPITMRIYRKER